MNADNETDDFANDKEIRRQRAEKAKHLKMVENSMKLISDVFNAKKSSRKNLKHYLLFKSISRPAIIHSFAGEWNNKPVYFSSVSYFTSLRAGRVRSEGTDDYLVGIITLKETYPHIIIQPEILALKIKDLFAKMDVDFKHARWFSFLYYVITKDKDLLRSKFESKNLNRIARFLDAEIEIIGRSCYFRVSRKPISMKEAERFVKLAKTIAEVL